MIDRAALSWKTSLAKSSKVAVDLQQFKALPDRRFKARLIPFLLDRKKTRDALLPGPFPRTLREFSSDAKIGFVDLPNELWWSGQILQNFKPQVATFLEGKRAIEQAIRLGDYSSAESLLDTLEESIGMSYWLLEMRIFLIGQILGLEAQKEYSREIKTSDASVLIKCFVHYVSLRCEPRVSWWKYHEYLTNFTAQFPVSDKRARAIFDFLLNPLRFTIETDPSSIMSLAASFPLVDYYEAFVRVAQKLVAQRIKSGSLGEIVESLYESGVKDPRLALICSVVGMPCESPLVHGVRDLDEVLCLYTAGKYTECTVRCAELLILNPTIFQLYELAAKSFARLKQEPSETTGVGEVDLLLGDLYNVVIKNDRADRSAADITKRAYNLSSSEFSAQLFSFLWHEFITDGLTPDTEVTYGLLNGSFYSPRNVFRLIPKAQRSAYLASLRQIVPTSRTLDFVETVASGQPAIACADVDPDRLRLYDAETLAESGKVAEAARALESICRESDDYVLWQDAMLRLNSLLEKEGEYGECQDLLANAMASNPVLVARLPIERLLDAIDLAGADFSGQISHPILREFVSRTGSPDSLQKRDDAYEDFLASEGVSRPSELADLKNNRFGGCGVMFLRDVCIPQVMDNSVAFDSTESLLNERIAICRMLIDLDPDGIEEYSSEIRKITQYLIVQRGLREVEQSKIYVDVSGISRSIEKSLKESYGRYCDLLAARVKPDQEDLLLKLTEMFGDQLVLVVPNDELRSLLGEMLLEVRDQFVSSNEYGLDGYLSTGLRHGTLAGQVRSIFEAEHLVTQRDQESLVYKEPSYWLDDLSIGVAAATEVSATLQDLSKGIDDLIDEVRTQWIQIRTEKKQTLGLFDYRLGPGHINVLQARMKLDTRYEDFIEAVFDLLWMITEANLRAVKRKIDEDLKPRILELVDQASSRINAISGDLSLLKNALTRSKTGSQNAIDKIASWFSRAKTSDIGPCEFDLPLKIAIAMVHNVFPSFSFECKTEVQVDGKLDGKKLTGLVNVFYLLFENIRKHCAQTDIPVRTTASIELHENRIAIRVVNPLHPEVDLEGARRKLDDSLALEDASFDYVRREGGSGFAKIRKILKVELRLDPEMHFEVRDDRAFCAEISFVATPLIL